MRRSTPQVVTDTPALLTDILGAGRMLGNVGRSTIYNLMNSGELKSVSLRNKGNIHGRRMILVESIEAYVQRLCEQ